MLKLMEYVPIERVHGAIESPDDGKCFLMVEDVREGLWSSGSCSYDSITIYDNF